MDKKLIFLDIDGTLVAALSSPTRPVKQAIQQARAKGHLVFLCTGRNLPIIGEDILEIGFDGVIASAGSYGAAAVQRSPGPPQFGADPHAEGDRARNFHSKI